jgi:DNA-binding transcriptional ArsR family regulator
VFHYSPFGLISYQEEYMPDDTLSLTLSALADPTRRGILARLAEGEATVNELAEPFDLKLPTVSKHLKVLQRAGLVTQGRRAQWRPCRLEPAPLKEVADWVDQYRQMWGERFDQLDRYFDRLDAILGDRKDDGRLDAFLDGPSTGRKKDDDSKP